MNLMSKLFPMHAAVTNELLAEDFAGEQHALPPALKSQISNLKSSPRSLLALLLRVALFQRQKFPGQTLIGKLNHLVKESGELRDAYLASDPDHYQEELADIFLLLLGSLELTGNTFDDLVQFAHAKMDINETREWHPAGPDGCFHHVK